jgi:hypothetical protein
VWSWQVLETKNRQAFGAGGFVGILSRSVRVRSAAPRRQRAREAKEKVKEMPVHRVFQADSSTNAAAVASRSAWSGGVRWQSLPRTASIVDANFYRPLRHRHSIYLIAGCFDRSCRDSVFTARAAHKEKNQ